MSADMFVIWLHGYISARPEAVTPAVVEALEYTARSVAPALPALLTTAPPPAPPAAPPPPQCFAPAGTESSTSFGNQPYGGTE